MRATATRIRRYESRTRSRKSFVAIAMNGSTENVISASLQFTKSMMIRIPVRTKMSSKIDTTPEVNNREEKAFETFSDVNAQHMEAFKDAIMAHAVYYPVVEILSSPAIASVIWFGGHGPEKPGRTHLCKTLLSIEGYTSVLMME